MSLTKGTLYIDTIKNHKTGKFERHLRDTDLLLSLVAKVGGDAQKALLPRLFLAALVVVLGYAGATCGEAAKRLA